MVLLSVRWHRCVASLVPRVGQSLTCPHKNRAQAAPSASPGWSGRGGARGTFATRRCRAACATRGRLGRGGGASYPPADPARASALRKAAPRQGLFPFPVFLARRFALRGPGAEDFRFHREAAFHVASEWELHTPGRDFGSRLGGGLHAGDCGFSSVSLIKAGFLVVLFFGRSILSRKWVAKMAKMACCAQNDPNDPNGVVF